MKYPGIPTYMMKCYSKLTYTMAAMSDLNFGFRIAGLAQEYGVDGYTTPQVMALAVELYEAGILTDEDMPGFPSDNEKRHFWLLDRIVRREGIGDVLAKGVYWATRQIGRGAEAYDHNTTKKHEQMPIKLGILNPIFFMEGYLNRLSSLRGDLPDIEDVVPLRHEIDHAVTAPHGKGILGMGPKLFDIRIGQVGYFLGG